MSSSLFGHLINKLDISFVKPRQFYFNLLSINPSSFVFT